MVDGFDSLRHNTIISRHHQNSDIGDVSTPRTHFSKGGVSWRIQEGNQVVIIVHLVGTDFLGDPPGFVFRNVGVPQLIQQGRLTMVNVSHNGNYWRPFNQVRSILLLVFKHLIDI